uniref:DNA-directed RNA polymerase II subunit RPB7 n=2 Tax=Aureoumbra lagunensis TaxID=44058 RepID=A0A7S3JRF2_9STRA|mmetsp:Transcript_3615/g.5070  ORF Transcript_3615/g.5070 Transcript_3615/m.5070 type:complete len:180 (+) Transcript_3615:36-575(+)
MVFFYKEDLEYTMYLPPKFFGPKMKTHIKQELMKNLEGKSLGRMGYVICIIKVDEHHVNTGIIDYQTGCVTVNARYSAILLRPFKNEVIDARVTVVNELGFYTEAGPLTIFVSRHAMPPDLLEGYDRDVEAWISDDKEVEIRQRCIVRLRLLGVMTDTKQITAVGTIKDDYLGLISMGY